MKSRLKADRRDVIANDRDTWLERGFLRGSLESCWINCRWAIKAIAAVVRGTPLKRARLSALMISNGLRYWYSKYEQLPKGVSVFAPSVREWATRNGVALRKLVTCSWLIL